MSEEKLLRVDLTPELAAAISGTYMLYALKNVPPTNLLLLAKLEREKVSVWERHATYCALRSGEAQVIALLSAYATTNGL